MFVLWTFRGLVLLGPTWYVVHIGMSGMYRDADKLGVYATGTWLGLYIEPLRTGTPHIKIRTEAPDRRLLRNTIQTSNYKWLLTSRSLKVCNVDPFFSVWALNSESR